MFNFIDSISALLLPSVGTELSLGVLPAPAVMGEAVLPPASVAGSGMVSVGGGAPPGEPAIMGAIKGIPDEEELIPGVGPPRNASHPWDLGVRLPSSRVVDCRFRGVRSSGRGPS